MVDGAALVRVSLYVHCGDEDDNSAQRVGGRASISTHFRKGMAKNRSGEGSCYPRRAVSKKVSQLNYTCIRGAYKYVNRNLQGPNLLFSQNRTEKPHSEFQLHVF